MTINSNLSLDTVLPVIAQLVRAGIRAPRVRKLTPGTRLYRFTSSAETKVNKIGPWWFGKTAFNQIVQDAIRDPEFGLGWAGRRNLAIRRQWSRVDVITEATINEEIFVFSGRGTHQYRDVLPNGMHFTWLAPAKIEQWFLPNINDKDGNITPEGERALRIYRTASVKSYRLPEG